MMQRDRGGLGKLAGEVSLPGTAPIDGVEQLRFHGHFPKLRRGPGGDSVHETEGKKVRVSAVSSSNNVEGSEGEKKQQHGTAVVVFNLGHGRARRCHGQQQLLRPPGGARESVE